MLTLRARVFFVVASVFAAACSSSKEGSSQSTSTASSSSSSSSSSTGGAGGGGGASSSSSSSAGGMSMVAASGDVKSYSYAFDIATAHAKSTVTIDVTKAGGCYAIDDGLAFANAMWNGGAATATSSMGILDACGADVAKGSTLTLTAEEDVPTKKIYNGLDVGYTKLKDLEGGQFTYMLSWVEGCDHFGPCDHDPSRLNEFHFDVTHPSGDVVLCPGKRTATATETKCDLTGTLAPTYSGFGLADDPNWKETQLIKTGSPTVSIFEVPGGKIATTLDVPSFSQYLAWIQSLLGPFPYGDELRFGTGPTEWLGFEHPADIILNDHLPTAGGYVNPVQHVMMHETAHQWSGDRATIATALDFVWKEATVEYLTYVFEDENRPAAEATGTRSYWKTISLEAEHYPRPTDDPSPPVYDFYGDVYGPGPMVLYVQLEAIAGRQKILSAIQSFLSMPGAKSVDDLQKALEAQVGQSLDAYFNAWVFGSGVPEWPTIALSSSVAGGMLTVTAKQMNMSGKIYPCKFDVAVQGASTASTATIDFTLAPTGDTATATVPFNDTVSSLTLDPDDKLVARDAAMPFVVHPKHRVFRL